MTLQKTFERAPSTIRELSWKRGVDFRFLGPVLTDCLSIQESISTSQDMDVPHRSWQCSSINQLVQQRKVVTDHYITRWSLTSTISITKSIELMRNVTIKQTFGTRIDAIVKIHRRNFIVDQKISLSSL
ncbi:hypothetical protein AVEN_151267-1 [Araneus ventricosus]|uniref:Uncharacterized protein n=1 Tax=Araneus ventricosus TaxID=182803 RepID=A0A4Y2HJY2_ARAVE|nr:hypothetical protein AVEN_151267-1 [Araneus ventricosus]